MSDSRQLIIFDTTLRDGEQSPGATMSHEEKLRIAKALEKLGVDVIEAGFAVSSKGDFKAVSKIAEEVKDSRVCSLSRANLKDIDSAGEALRKAAASRIHTFIATSPLHMKYKLKMDEEQVLETAVAAVAHARRYTDDVEFSCEDASRSDLDFLCRVLEATIKAGAGTINIPDTVGYGMPLEFGALFATLIERVPGADDVVFSAHCHNDLGLAVANSLSAVANGARQVECTINGLGERAGNAALEEIVMAVRTRPDLYDLHVDIDATQIVPCSKLVSTITGFPVQPNKAIVGANAFVHESGIHQDGVIKRRETYEIMRAQDVGWNSNRLALGKLSGRNALRQALEKLGASVPEEERFEELFHRFKELADIKKEVFDEDLRALLGGLRDEEDHDGYKLLELDFRSAGVRGCDAAVELEVDGEARRMEASGDGAVDACYRALEEIVASGAELLLYSVNAITGGSDSQGKVLVRLQRDNRVVNGVGADTDIVRASVKAYISALNHLREDARLHPQHREGV